MMLVATRQKRYSKLKFATHQKRYSKLKIETHQKRYSKLTHNLTRDVGARDLNLQSCRYDGLEVDEMAISKDKPKGEWLTTTWKRQTYQRQAKQHISDTNARQS